MHTHSAIITMPISLRIPAELHIIFSMIKEYRQSEIATLREEMESTRYRSVATFIDVVRPHFPPIATLVAEGKVSSYEATGRLVGFAYPLPAYCAGCGTIRGINTISPANQLLLECPDCYKLIQVSTSHLYLDLLEDFTGYPRELLEYWYIYYQIKLNPSNITVSSTPAP